MVNLWVDVDDTLVLYQNDNVVNPFGYYLDTPYLFNEKLIKGIKKFARDHPAAMVVVWSGGGAEYARMWSHKLNIAHLVHCLTKDKETLTLVKEGDICVDDMEDIKERTHDPFSWPE